jgi:hypothetical protein
MTATSDKRKEISEILNAARAQVYVCAEALGNGGNTDLEAFTATALRSVVDQLTECGDHFEALCSPVRPRPKPPGKRRAKPVLRVVKSEGAA